MSTTVGRKPTPPEGPPEKDPFRYGWRYVRRKLPDGGVVYDQVPLARKDLLHPEEDDFVVQTDQHWDDCIYLGGALTHHLADDPTAKVLVDHRIAWDDPALKAHGPDVMVIFGVKKDWHKPGGTFYVGAEGVRPTLAMEITSPATRRDDLGIKVDHYHRARVPYYVIVDARYRKGRRTTVGLIGYRWTPQRYEPMPLDGRGRLWLEPLGLWLGVEGVQVVLYDRDGNKLLNYRDLAQARETAEAEAKAEAEARKAAEEQTRAEAEARKAAEERIKELEAQLRRARKKQPKKKPRRKK